MLFHTPTLFVVMILVSLVLAVSIALAGYSKHTERFFWAGGLACQAGAYILFALRGSIPDWPSIVLGNVLLSASFALYTSGLSRFRGLHWPVWLIWGPVAVVAAVFWWLVDQTTPRLIAGALLTIAQLVLVVATVLVRRQHPALRGEWLIALGGVAMMSLMIVRLWASLTGRLQIQFVTDGGFIQGLTFLLAVTSTLLLAIGLIIMSEQRAENALETRQAFQQYRSRILEMLASGTPLSPLLLEVVKGIEQLNPLMHCSILLVDRDGKRLIHGAAPSLPDFYNQAVNGLAIGHGAGSCGTAAHLKERVIVSDIAHHPYWSAYQSLAEQAHLAACWSQPILSSNGDVLGTFAIYHSTPHAPGKDDIALIEELAILTGLAIERTRSEEQRRAAEAEVQHQALHDGLTQLPNRGLLLSRIEQSLASHRRSKKQGALMFIDLDNFKPLNDQHGHAVGDLLLIEVARRLTSNVREMDTVARFGGDEFVVLLHELDADLTQSEQQAQRIAHKMLQLLSEPYMLRLPGSRTEAPPITHLCTASIGLAVFNGGTAEPDAILQKADAAMYRAKEGGRNQVVFKPADPIPA